MKTVFPYNSIKATYDAALPSFADSYKVHFCTRLFRATGDELYLNYIKQYITANIETLLKKLRKLNSLEAATIELSEPIRGTILRNPIEHTRIVRRQNYYQQKPELKYYFDAISTLYFLFDFKIHQGKYSKELLEVIALYKQFPWIEKFAIEEHLLVHPVLFVNSMYQLYEMGMIDSLGSMHQMIAEHFPPSAQFTNEKLFDQLYVYTHILINESNFYQKFLNEVQVNQYQWILDFFEKNLENYITVVNIDLLVEVLTCFFLSKKTSPIEEKILEHLFTFYDTDEQYLKKDAASTLQDMEHAHSIFLLYLNKPSKLHTV